MVHEVSMMVDDAYALHEWLTLVIVRPIIVNSLSDALITIGHLTRIALATK